MYAHKEIRNRRPQSFHSMVFYAAGREFEGISNFDGAGIKRLGLGLKNTSEISFPAVRSVNFGRDQGVIVILGFEKFFKRLGVEPSGNDHRLVRLILFKMLDHIFRHPSVALLDEPVKLNGLIKKGLDFFNVLEFDAADALGAVQLKKGLD